MDWQKYGETMILKRAGSPCVMKGRNVRIEAISALRFFHDLGLVVRDDRVDHLIKRAP